jgi:uncharacterized protein
VGAASGRIDAIAFMAGLIAGVWIFAEAYTALAAFVWTGDLGPLTFADLLGVPFWVLALALLIVTVLLARVLRRVEAGRAS